MSQQGNYIAVDLGAESGRVMLGNVRDDRLCLEEVHRFANIPVKQGHSLRWDFDTLLSDVKTGIARAVARCDEQILGVAVDSWGVDYGLLGREGRLLEKPYHYRDSRTDGIMDKAFELIPKREIYEHTGIQFMQINSIYQLLATRLYNPELLAEASRLIFMADLVSYHLCGRAFAEYTLASTSQLMDMRTGDWSGPVFEKLSLPLEIMPEVVKPGTVVGSLTKEVAAEIGCGRVPVIAVGSHDTADAVAAVPAEGENWAYLSSGTWSLLGVETAEPVINDVTFEHQFTNEGGVGGTVTLLKNITGLWLAQECRRQWQHEGADFSYAEFTQMAKQASPFFGWVNPNDSDFLAPGEMPARINKYLENTGQKQTNDKGQLVRVILESLAFYYRWVLERIEQVTGRRIDVVHMVGGGIKNELLCQFTADATGRVVIAGPVEATASGNVLMQAVATGQIGSVSQARRLTACSFDVMNEYHPENVELWAREYEKVEPLFGG